MSLNDKAYQKITDQIIKIMESGRIPWIRTWNAGGAVGRPLSATSGEPYRGINEFLLGCAADEKAYNSRYWVTFVQAQKLGGYVKQGEKATPAIFWTLWKHPKETDKNGKPKQITLLKVFRVFNLDQCEGVTLPPRMEKHDRTKKPTLNANERIETADRIATEYMNREGIELETGGNQPAYSYARDVVIMPKLKHFDDSEKYYQTFFHEIIHSTGHPNRKARKIANKFGSSSYAKEELVAEIGAAYLCNVAGIEPHIENTAAYLQSWLSALRNDKKLIVEASSQARRAVEYVTDTTDTPVETAA